MVELTFHLADGDIETVSVDAGETVMDAAVDHGIAGIFGQCGGGRTCLTCHCYVDPAWIDRVPPACAEENELMAYVVEPGVTSRLACQIVLTPDLSGLHVTVPERQI